MPEVLSRITVPAPLSDAEAARLGDMRPPVRFWAESITGDGQETEYVVAHNLGTEDLIVQVRDAATREAVAAGNALIDANSVKLVFSTAPAAGQSYRVNIIGLANYEASDEGQKTSAWNDSQSWDDSRAWDDGAAPGPMAGAWDDSRGWDDGQLWDDGSAEPLAGGWDDARWNHEKRDGFKEIAADPEGWGMGQIVNSIRSAQARGQTRF